jgi:hypothetical protein
MSEPRNAIYDQDLTSRETYDLTAQSDDLSDDLSADLSADTTPDLLDPTSLVRPRPRARLGPHAHVPSMLADASLHRRALRLALAMVLGRNDGFLTRRK